MQRSEFLNQVKYNLQQRLCDVDKIAGLGIHCIVIVYLGNRQRLPVTSSRRLLMIMPPDYRWITQCQIRRWQ